MLFQELEQKRHTLIAMDSEQELSDLENVNCKLHDMSQKRIGAERLSYLQAHIFDSM